MEVSGEKEERAKGRGLRKEASFNGCATCIRTLFSTAKDNALPKLLTWSLHCFASF